MKSLESSYDLHEKMPNLLLIELGSILLVLLDQLKQVTVVGVFHNNAKVARGGFEKGVFIPDNVGMLD